MTDEEIFFMHAKAMHAPGRPLEKKMTPHEYQQFALSTYCAPDHIDRTDYLHHLLIEEVGEVMSLFAKSMRDGHTVDRDRLVSELGDVLWCVACLDHAEGYSMGTEWRRPASSMSRVSASIRIVADHDIHDVARLAIACLPTLTLEEVAIANVAKLTSRRDRGVLKGGGDDR